ncbi:unnamed protein product [Camellia sinensis]
MVEKRAEVRYNIHGNAPDDQNGTLTIPRDVKITASDPGQADIHQIAAMRVNHIGFLRAYFVDGTNKKIIYEPWQYTLSDWLSLSSVQKYKHYIPEGFTADHYKISMDVIDYIRYLLYALMHLHKKNYCVDGNFTIDNVVISNGMPKFKGLGVRLINEKQKEQEVAQVKGDYTNFRKLVNRILTYNDSPCPPNRQTPEGIKCPEDDSNCAQHSKCPADMRHFLDLLPDPIGNEILIMYHCALWTSKQKMGYLHLFHDGWDYLPGRIQKSLEIKFDNITELGNWKADAMKQKNSPLYRVYQFKNRPKYIRYHFEFLRHYIAHVSKKVTWRDYDLNKVEGVLTATYPLSLCFLLKKLHEIDPGGYWLIEYLPKKLENVFQ